MECKEFRMKQQQEVFQMLLSSHLVQLVWYRAVVEALIQLRKQDEKPSYVNAGVQTLPLPPLPPPLPAESHVQVDPPDPILPRVRPPSPLSSITTPEPPEAQHVDPTPKEPYVDQPPEAYVSQYAEVARPTLSRVRSPPSSPSTLSMPQPYVDHYTEPNAEVYTEAYAKKHEQQDPIPNIEPYNQTPPRSQPDEPLSPLSCAQPPSLSQLFLPSSLSCIPASLSTRSQQEAPYVEPDHAEPLCFDEYGRSCTLADLYKNVRPPTSSHVSQPAELATIEVELSEPVMKKFKPVRVLDLRKF